jgi:hypothetical protein
VNQKLFGAIVIAGAALAACRSGAIGSSDLAQPRDMAVADAAAAVDLAGDMPTCCWDVPPGNMNDLSGCIPISCILI